MSTKSKEKDVRDKLKELAAGAVKDINNHKNPFLDIPLRSLSNVHFNEIKSIIELGSEKQKRYF